MDIDKAYAWMEESLRCAEEREDYSRRLKGCVYDLLGVIEGLKIDSFESSDIFPVGNLVDDTRRLLNESALQRDLKWREKRN